MSNDIYLIVEGDGEVTAAPLLLRKLLDEYLQRYDFTIPRPINANGRGNLLRSKTGLERFLELLRPRKECKGVLILLDAEHENRDCPPSLAFHLSQRAQVLNLPFSVVVVCAVCEYESWFLLNLHTEIKNALRPGVTYAGVDPEQKCGAKEWLSEHMPAGVAYKETLDQAKMTAHIDILHTMKNSRSFRRMVNGLEELIKAIDTGSNIVSPIEPTNDQN